MPVARHADVGARPSVPRGELEERSLRQSQRIAEDLQRLIRAGEWAVGEKLPAELQLCRRFGVSKLTLREALRSLEAAGLIAVKVGGRGGAYVGPPRMERLWASVDDLVRLSVMSPAQLFEAREALELPMLALVCKRADERDIVELLTMCDHAAAIVAQGESVPLRLSADFHIRLAAASHNTAIKILAEFMQGAALMALRVARGEVAPRVGAPGNVEHRQLVMAIKAGDGVAAREIMGRHLQRTAESATGFRSS